jgi:hypothetical protein
MVTTVADTSATVDVEAYEVNTSTGSVGSDLITTSATTINTLLTSSTTTVDFTVNNSTVAANDLLDVRITVDISDAATGTAVIAELLSTAFVMALQ